MMYENYGKCYNVDSSMADVYYDFQNNSDSETKVFTLESSGSNASFTSNESYSSSSSFARGIPENNSENQNKVLPIDSNSSNVCHSGNTPDNDSDNQIKVFTVDAKANDGLHIRNAPENSSDFQSKVFTMESNENNMSYTRTTPENNTSYARTTPENNISYARTTPESNMSYTRSTVENNTSYARTTTENNMSYARTTPENNMSYARTTPENNMSYARTTPENNMSYTRTIPESNVSYARTAPDNNMLYARSTPENNMLYARNAPDSSSESPTKVNTMESKGNNLYIPRSTFENVDPANKVFPIESRGSNTPNARDVAENLSETYTNSSNHSNGDSTFNLRKVSDPPTQINSFESSKYEYFSDFEKTDGNKMLVHANEILSPSNIKGEESIVKIFNEEMEEDEEVPDRENPTENNVPEYNTKSHSELVNGMPIKSESHGKIFTVESIVSGPTNGLQKSFNGNWLCDICGHEEPLKDDILTHRILHLSDDHSKQCPICEKKFSSSTSLRNHLTVHTGIKKFRCKYCGRKFGWKTQLAIHENLHTGKGLHHCHVCSKSFMTKWLLQRHIKIHLKDKGRTDDYKKMGNNNWNTGVKMGVSPVKFEYSEMNTSGAVSYPVELPAPRLPRCHECNQTFKGEDALAYHLLQHNLMKQNMKTNSSMKNQILDESSDRDVENWTSSSVGNIDQEKLKMNNMKNQSKGSLTSIVSKLHNKVDEKQKSENDESTEVLVLESSADEHYMKDSSAPLNTDYKLTDSLSKEMSKQPMSTSSDPFISGISEMEHRRESGFMSMNTMNTLTSTSKGKNIEPSLSRLPANELSSRLPANELSSRLPANELPNSKQNDVFQRELRGYFMKHEKELSSLQSMVATLHGKVDSLTNIVTSQSLLINRFFLGGKMAVNGLLDFNVRPSNGDS